jgi:hypothetical protein
MQMRVVVAEARTGYLPKNDLQTTGYPAGGAVPFILLSTHVDDSEASLLKK